MEFKKTIGFISLGCDKNRVDLEHIIAKFNREEFVFTKDESEANILIINTCAFIEPAREEARDTILEMLNYKKTGKLEKLIVTGCLAILQKQELIQQIAGIDAVVLPEDYNNIVQIVFDLYKQKFKAVQLQQTRLLTTPYHYAYVKIADGCNNYCSFCKIPYIRGNYKSRKTNEIVDEVKDLVNRGVKEIILVAQDVTRFGIDTGESLVELLQQLGRIKNLVWIRLLYLYPDLITDDLIEEINNNPKVVHYVDMPLQHISDDVLSLMKRRSRKIEILELINKLRTQIPDIKIRSTFMVGFPGETKEDFKQLCEFLKKYKLDNVGFFKFSREEGTSAYNLPEQVEERQKDKRLGKIETLQQKIIVSKNRSLKGETFKVIVDGKDGDYYIGRPYFSAPDVDYVIYFRSFYKLLPGAFVDVTITNFKDYYFIGVHDKNSTY